MLDHTLVFASYQGVVERDLVVVYLFRRYHGCWRFLLGRGRVFPGISSVEPFRVQDGEVNVAEGNRRMVTGEDSSLVRRSKSGEACTCVGKVTSND